MNEAIKQTVKRVAYTALSKVYYLSARILPNIFGEGKTVGTDKAKQVLEANGYVFLPLWNELPPLQEDSLDISFIIPVYNSEAYLSKCLDAILNQKTQCRYEVICVNDGSTDRSGEILKDYKARFADKLKLVVQTNRGISAARNAGLECAAGRYVGFIDNDDTVDVDYVETLFRRIEETGADIVQVGFKYVTTTGAVASVHTKSDMTITADDQGAMVKNVSGYIWSGCFRKSLFDKIRFPVGFWYEDMITKLLIMRVCESVSIVGRSLYNKLLHENNASNTLWKRGDIKAADQYWLAQSVCEYAETAFSLRSDNMLYTLLLYEWSGILFVRTDLLPSDVKHALFSLCSAYMCKIRPVGYVPDGKYIAAIDEAFSKANYAEWLLASKALGYKIRI